MLQVVCAIYEPITNSLRRIKCIVTIHYVANPTQLSHQIFVQITLHDPDERHISQALKV
jgi:hypothetical protein